MDIESAPQVLQNLPSWLLSQSALVAQRAVARSLENAAGSRSEYAALASLEEFGEHSQMQLSERIGRDKSDVVKLVDKLVEDGFVSKRPHPTDRRRNVLRITKAGKQRLQTLNRAIDEAQDEVIHGLTEAEQQQLIKLLTRLLATTA